MSNEGMEPIFSETGLIDSAMNSPKSLLLRVHFIAGNV